MRRAVLLLALGGMSWAASCASFSSSSDTPPSDAASSDAPSPPSPPDAASDAQPSGDAGGGSAYRAAVLKDSPIVYWRMGVASGAPSVPDETGGAHTLFLQGNGHVYGVAGALAHDPDTAIGFDGVSAYALLQEADAVAFMGAQPFTVECFVKQTKAGSSQFIVTNSMGSGSSRAGWVLYADSAPKVHFEYLPGVPPTQDVDTPLASNKWTHVAGVYDGMHAQLYVDGTLAPADSSDAGALPMLSGPLYVAADHDQSEFFAGGIDEMAIYGRALDLSEITAHIAAARE
ncbi:MAG TPA: LamG domain-containing protein [Labilithrix sp.]